MESGNWEAFFEIVDAMLATIPYSLFDKKEKYFHSLLHVLLASTGYMTFSEVQNNLGRMDLVLTMSKAVFIFEFKIDKTAEEALLQIKEMEYPKRFAQLNSSTTLIAVSFDSENRKIGDWKVEIV
jgi:hypothetical protein